MLIVIVILACHEMESVRFLERKIEKNTLCFEYISEVMPILCSGLYFNGFMET